MAVKWNRVTWYSQAFAVILGIIIFGAGYWFGIEKGKTMTPAPLAAVAPTQDGTPVIADVTYACDGGKTIHAIYRANSVQVLLSDGRNLMVPQALSGSGARYANDDESFVFWNKGTTAFVTEGAGTASKTTYANCNQTPIPE